ncbi:MAG: rod shape-determining protein MreD [Nitrospirota bacterium]
MKKFLLYLIMAYLALTVQAIFFKGSKPDFVLVLVCFYSLRHGDLRGIAYGALTGLLIDTAGGVILGPHIVSKSLAAFLIWAVREKMFQWNIFINTVLIAILSIVDIFVVYICLEVFSGVPLDNMPIKIFVMQVIYTVVASVAAYKFLKPGKVRDMLFQD